MVDRSDCDTVVISCENRLLPMDPDRDQMIAALAARFAGFRAVEVVAFVRRPDLWAEMFFRELVANGNRLGARSLDEFLVDFEGLLTDLPALFGPFEAALGCQVTLLDHDALAPGNQHWDRFATTAGLPPRVLALKPAAQTYPSPDREAVLAAQAATGRNLLLSPAQRGRLLAALVAKSPEFAAARGYTPDYAALQAAWQAPTAISFDLLERVGHAFAQTRQPLTPKVAPSRQQHADPSQRDANALTLKIGLRPWARRIVDRFRGRG